MAYKKGDALLANKPIIIGDELVSSGKGAQVIPKGSTLYVYFENKETQDKYVVVNLPEEGGLFGLGSTPKHIFIISVKDVEPLTIDKLMNYSYPKVDEKA